MSNENKKAPNPCRFCGSKETHTVRRQDATWAVRCAACWATGPMMGSEEAAVAWWNEEQQGVKSAPLPTQVRWPGGKFAKRNGDEYVHIVGSEHMSVRQMPSGTWQAAYAFKASTMRVCAPDPQTAADHCVLELETQANGWAPWVFEERDRWAVEVSELQAKICKIGTALGISHGSVKCWTMTDAEYTQQVLYAAMGHAAEVEEFQPAYYRLRKITEVLRELAPGPNEGPNEAEERLAAVTSELDRLRSLAQALEDERDGFARRLSHLSSVEESDKAGKPVDWLINAIEAEVQRLRMATMREYPVHQFVTWRWDISAERERQRRKFGDQHLEHHPGLALAILMEEVGEVAEALLKREGVVALRSELVQVAAVCVQWIENIDRAPGEDAQRCIEKLVSGSDGEGGVARG